MKRFHPYEKTTEAGKLSGEVVLSDDSDTEDSKNFKEHQHARFRSELRPRFSLNCDLRSTSYPVGTSLASQFVVRSAPVRSSLFQEIRSSFPSREYSSRSQDDSVNFDPHLVKTSQQGAAAVLKHSQSFQHAFQHPVPHLPSTGIHTSPIGKSGCPGYRTPFSPVVRFPGTRLPSPPKPMYVGHSVRMGPPYPLLRHNFPPGPQIRPVGLRFSHLPVNISDSSSGGSSPVSTEPETESDDFDVAHSHQTPLFQAEVAAQTCQEFKDSSVKIEFFSGSEKPRAMMATCPMKGQHAPVIVIGSDDEGSPPCPPRLDDGGKKAKMCSIEYKKKDIKLSEETRVIREYMPAPSDQDELNLDGIMAYGMSLLSDPTDFLQKIQEVASQGRPKRLRTNPRVLYSHVKHGSLKKALPLLCAGANPSDPVASEKGRTALHAAAAKGHLDLLLLLVYKVGGCVNVVDDSNRTPMHVAVERGNLAMVKFLYFAGAKLNFKTTEGLTFLHIAAHKGSLDIVKWLLRNGVDVNERDNFGWTALMWAVEQDSSAPIVKILLKHGAETCITDREVNICLHWSAMAKSYQCCQLLVQHKSPINAKNKFGETPLHVAAKADSFQIVQYLLIHGADPAIENNNGETAVDVCPEGSKTYTCIRIREAVGSACTSARVFISDISCGKERIPVSAVNEVDDEPFPSHDFVYIVEPEESGQVKVNRGLSMIRPCKCETCGSGCPCVKLSEKHKLWYSEDGRVSLDLFEEDSPVLFECTRLCSCWSCCPNRVAQKGLQYPLQVFKTLGKGWGLRALSAIPQGAFILGYSGELISDEEAERRSADTYLFNLDLKTSGDEPNCMDACKFGNCGRFINHSCEANMKAVKLFTSHRDVSFPEVAFFACADIQPKEELCFNYGESFWEVKFKMGLHCKCGTDTCQYR